MSGIIFKSTFVILKEKMDYQIKLKSGHTLKGFIMSPGDKCRAMIILVHGLGEHTGRYDHWAARFIKEGIGFTGVDLPGHGLSDGAKGNIRSYSDTDEMLDIIIENASKTFPGTPLILYGHSLGGGILLDYLLRKNPPVIAAVVTSPWLKLSFEPAKSKLLLASVMKSILPGLAQPSGLVVEHISHDKNVVEKYKADPLVHDKISVSLFHNAMSAASRSLEHAFDLKIPLLLVHGSDDLICSPRGSSEFASKTNMAELKIWEGGFHELHNEIFNDEVFIFIMNWINKKII